MSAAEKDKLNAKKRANEKEKYDNMSAAEKEKLNAQYFYMLSNGSIL